MQSNYAMSDLLKAYFIYAVVRQNNISVAKTKFKSHCNDAEGRYRAAQWQELRDVIGRILEDGWALLQQVREEVSQKEQELYRMVVQREVVSEEEETDWTQGVFISI